MIFIVFHPFLFYKMLLSSHRDFVEDKSQIENSMLFAKTWFSVNNLKINEDKTELIVFSLNYNVLEKETNKSVKALGIHLDSIKYKIFVKNYHG